MRNARIEIKEYLNEIEGNYMVCVEQGALKLRGKRWKNGVLISRRGKYIQLLPIQTDESQPRRKYIFDKIWNQHLCFFTQQKFGPSPSPNFKRPGGIMFVKNHK